MTSKQGLTNGREIFIYLMLFQALLDFSSLPHFFFLSPVDNITEERPLFVHTYYV